MAAQLMGASGFYGREMLWFVGLIDVIMLASQASLSYKTPNIINNISVITEMVTAIKVLPHKTMLFYKRLAAFKQWMKCRLQSQKPYNFQLHPTLLSSGFLTCSEAQKLHSWSLSSD